VSLSLPANFFFYTQKHSPFMVLAVAPSRRSKPYPKQNNALGVFTANFGGLF
jgi:hypothetical protein